MYLSIPGSSHAWRRVPEAFDWSQASLSPAQLLPGVPTCLPQEIPVHVDLYRTINVQHQGDMQGQHVQMPYSQCLASTNNTGYHGPLIAADLEGHVCLPTTANDLGSAPRTVNRSVNPTNLAAAGDGIGPRAVGPRLECNMAPYLEVPKEGDMPVSANYGIGFSIPYIRRTKTGRRAPVCGPPQTFEGHPDVLTARLADEGADPDAVDLIRRVIFVDEVTEGALTAPIKSRELSLKYGGVRKKWQLLLQVTNTEPGVKSHCCRLCPLERRPEYKNASDGLRHLKRDHFGICVECEYW
jgi:hypothetical protein